MKDSVTYPPLQQIRQTKRVNWYRSPIDPKQLRLLMQRSDTKGLFQTVGALILVSGSAVLSYYLFLQQSWIAFGITFFLHGTMASIYVSGGHELDHGTVFKTRWLNRFFLKIYALLSWFNFHDYALSHTYHHRYTLHPAGDREVVLPQSPILRFWWLIQLFTINITGGPMAAGLIITIRETVRNALNRPLSGCLEPDGYDQSPNSLEWIAALYVAHPEERKKSVRWSRIMLLFHGLVIVLAVLSGFWLLPVFVSLNTFIANWWRYIIWMPMHCGMRDNIADFRKCTRSIKLDPLSSFLYFRMNWHMEHHMYAGVPCYNLRKLRRVIQADLPQCKSVWGAWKEMRKTWNQQKTEPGYQYDTPLPETANHYTSVTKTNFEGLDASIGDLAPTVLSGKS